LCIRTAVAYSFFGGADEDFAALTSPTADDLRQVSDPSEEDFQHLLQTNQQEAAMYLMGETYSAEFAEMYIQQYGLSQGTAQEKGIAEKFFSEDPDKIIEYSDAFTSYLSTEGVSLTVASDASVISYSADGTLKCEQTQINVKQFAEDYSFKVNQDGSISLIPKKADSKTSQKEYLVTGVVKRTPQGKLQIMGDGSFAGRQTKDVYHLWIDDSGNINIVAKSFAGMEFEEPGLVTYFPGQQLDGKEKFMFKGSKIKGTTHTLSGDVYFDTKQKKYYAGNGILTVDNVKVKRTQGNLVEIAVFQDNWFDDATSFVRAAIGTEGSGQQTRVSFDEDEGAVNLESQEGDIYTATVSQEQMQEKADEVNPNQLTLPARGYYVKGDTGEGVKTIQKLLGFRDNQITGVYDDKTIAAVQYFQLKAGIKEDGYWGKKTRQAYLSNPEEIASSVTLTMDGGVVRIGSATETMSVDAAGSVELDYKGKEYDLHDSVIDARLGTALSQSGALTLTTRDAEGNPIVIVDNQGLRYAIHEGQVPELTAVEQAFINGEFNVKQAAGARVEMVRGPGDNCAAYTTAAISLLDGARKLSQDYGAYIGFTEDGPINYAIALGVLGNTWNLEDKMVAAGGEVVFDKRTDVLSEAERIQLQQVDARISAAGSSVVYGTPLQAEHNALMGEQVSYSNNNFQSGDVVTMYYGHTQSLSKAVASGQDTTHSGVVLGSKMEYATYDYEKNPSQSLKGFISQQTGVSNPTLLGNFPVQIVDETGNWRKVTLATDGKYYFAEDVSADRTPVSGSQRVILNQNTQVAIKETYITDNVHGQMGVYEINKYFNDNPYISLSQHLRPNQEVMQQARKPQIEGEYDVVQVTAELYQAPDMYAQILRQQGALEEDIPTLVEQMNEEDRLKKRGSLKEGDIILVPKNPSDPATTEPKDEGILLTFLEDVGI
jgi:hypothetical protein